LCSLKSPGLAIRSGLWETVDMIEQLCKNCEHLKSKHATGRCTVEVPVEGSQEFRFCGCVDFKPKREDASQAAARIVKEATK